MSKKRKPGTFAFGIQCASKTGHNGPGVYNTVRDGEITMPSRFGAETKERLGIIGPVVERNFG